MSLTTLAEQREFLDEVLKLNFHALLHLTADLMRAMGYDEVRLSSRTGFVGRNHDGGFDLVALRPVPGGARRVLIQVKQYPLERPVFRRAVHELVGVCAEYSAAEGLLITTSTFSTRISSARLASAPLLPLRLIDGTTLAELCALYRVGIKKEWTAQGPRYLVDRAYLTELEKNYPGIARANPGEQRIVAVMVTIPSRKRRS